MRHSWLLLFVLNITQRAMALSVVKSPSIFSGLRPSTTQMAASGVEHRSYPSSSASPIDLTMAFQRKSPAATLRDLSEAADAYNIEEQDVYGGGAPWLTEFEDEVARLLGKDAALFCPSGVMAQLIALKIHAQTAEKQRSLSSRDGGSDAGTLQGRSFLVHPSSHLLLHEKSAHKELIGFDAVPVGIFERPASFDDLVEALDRLQETGETKGGLLGSPSCFVLELPHRELGGACTSLQDIEAMSKSLKDRGIAFHLDGARLWEAQPFCGQPFSVICDNFDSVYVSFYKGLGGMTGAMLAGSDSFVTEARVWLRRFGGNIFTSLPYALSCMHAYRTQLGTFEGRWHKLKRITSLIDNLDRGMTAGGTTSAASDTSSTEVDGLTTGEGSRGSAEVSVDAAAVPGRLVRFEPAIPQCSMVHCYIRGAEATLLQARDEVLEEKGVRVFNRLRGTPSTEESTSPQAECYFEWNIGPINGSIEDEVFVDAWALFLEKVQARNLDGIRA